MNYTELTIEKQDVQKLLGAANGDTALLYLYLRSGNDPVQAGKNLQLNESRLACACANLRQLGLWQEEKKQFIAGQRPDYTEGDVVSAMDTDRDFKLLYGEIQRVLGRTLNTEELKIILGFVRYLGLGCDVISILISYCINRNRRKGLTRNPSLRTIEKEAYAWAEQGIDTLEEASAFINRQNVRYCQVGQLMELLQIRGRSLTAPEEKYANRWMDAGFSKELLTEAYQRTCVNTGGMNWRYMNTILTRWQEAGYQTLQQVKDGDQKKTSMPKGASGKLGDAEMEAMRKMLQEV